MTIQSTLLAQFATRIAGGESFDMRPLWENASDEIIAHLAWHGAGQKMGDAYSTFKGTKEEKLAQAQKVFDNLVAGNLRATRTGDPVATEARKLAIAKAKKDWPGTVTPDIYKSDAFRAKVAELQVHPEIIKRAEKMAELANMDELDI